jgi:hypothetical protein
MKLQFKKRKLDYEIYISYILFIQKTFRNYLFYKKIEKATKLIQKSFNKYKLNKKVKIFKILPYELKNYIIFLSNRYERFNKSLEKILIYKFNNFCNSYFLTRQHFIFLENSIINYYKLQDKYKMFNIIGPKIIHIAYLMVKYKSILINSTLFKEKIHDDMHPDIDFYPPTLFDKILLILRMIQVKGKKSFSNFDNYYLKENIDFAFNIYNN